MAAEVTGTRTWSKKTHKLVREPGGKTRTELTEGEPPVSTNPGECRWHPPTLRNSTMFPPPRPQR